MTNFGSCRAVAAALLCATFVSMASANASPIQSLTTVIGGPPISTFDGFADGTPLGGPPGAGISFGEPFNPGFLPVADAPPLAAGYVAVVGGVLTGHVPGAAIHFRFAQPRSDVEIFLSDTNPAGPYSISAFDILGNTLESFLVQVVVGQGLALPGSLTTPRVGLYVGFSRPTADIGVFGIGHSSAALATDVFALDNLRTVPEPASIMLLTSGLVGLAYRRRAGSRRPRGGQLR